MTQKKEKKKQTNVWARNYKPDSKVRKKIIKKDKIQNTNRKQTSKQAGRSSTKTEANALEHQ